MPPSTAPAGYDPADFPPFAVTADLVALTIRSGALHALLVTRAVDPYAGSTALPGGFVRPDEGLAEAASRVLSAKTGLDQVPGHLEQLGSYGTPDRDPRMRIVSVAYLALAPSLPEPVAGGDVADATWTPVSETLGATLAFDHATILADGVARARAKLEYTSLATAFCGAEFTVSELRAVYEAVWGQPLDPRNFHRKVTSTPGFLTPTGRTVESGPGRPAALYRAGSTTALHPPLVRDA